MISEEFRERLWEAECLLYGERIFGVRDKAIVLKVIRDMKSMLGICVDTSQPVRLDKWETSGCYGSIPEGSHD